MPNSLQPLHSRVYFTCPGPVLRSALAKAPWNDGRSTHWSKVAIFPRCIVQTVHRALPETVGCLCVRHHSSSLASHTSGSTKGWPDTRLVSNPPECPVGPRQRCVVRTGKDFFDNLRRPPVTWGSSGEPVSNLLY